MALARLLALNAPARIGGMLGRLLSGTTAGGQPFRRNLTEAVRRQVEQGLAESIGLTGWQERRMVQEMVTAINQSQRIAFRVQRGGEYPTRPRNIPTDPNTIGYAGTGYTYTVIVVDPLGEGTRASSTPVTFTSERLLTMDEIRVRAQTAISRGDVLEQYTARVPGLQRQPDLEFVFLNVYRGGIDVGTRP